MSNLLTVQDPDENAVEHATRTRELLRVWADKHLPNNEPELIQELSATAISEYRQAGVRYLEEAKAALEGKGDIWKPQNEFSALLLQFTGATCDIGAAFSLDSRPRELSHALEGLVREFHKQFFQAGMKWNLHAEYLASISMHVPARTSGYQDRIWDLQTGAGCLSGNWHTNMRLAECSSENWHPAWDKFNTPLAQKFEPIVTWLLQQADTPNFGWLEIDSQRWLRTLTGVGSLITAIHYMDADGPWVAGFLNMEDACRLRFRRIRLGAFLTEYGLSDGDVRQRVEKAKQQVAGATFEAYPNDTEWGHLYTSGPSSCMSDDADVYETWNDTHPVSAYSSSYHGCGDNSLVLLISRDGDGCVVGRGILNLQRGSIVRWYGDPIAERVLKRSGVNVSDRGSFEGTWLALLEQGGRFIHPYVDGNLGYGDIRADRVYIGDGGISLQETGGSSYRGEVQYCIDIGEYAPEDECTHQPISGTYISSDCEGWRCPIIDEYDRDYDRVRMRIHGVEVEVHSHVYYNASSFLSQADDFRPGYQNYTIDDDDVRAAFFEYYAIDDEDEAA